MPVWPFLLAYLAPGCLVAGWMVWRLRDDLEVPRRGPGHPEFLELPLLFLAFALAC